MKRLFYVLVLVLFCSSLVLAEDVQVEITPKNPDIFPGEKAEFVLQITNQMDGDIIVNLKSIDLNWVLEQNTEKFEVKQGRTKEIELTYSPLGNLLPNAYGANLIVYGDNFNIEKILPINVLDYQNLVNVDFVSLPSVDPRKGTLIKVDLANKYLITMDNVEITISSGGFDEKQNLDLGPKETAQLEFPVSFNSRALEGSYPVRVMVTWGDNLVYDNFFDMNIASVENLKELTNLEEGLFFSAVNIDRTNEGNSVDTKDLVVELSLFEKLFTNFVPEPTSMEKVDGKYVIIWSQSLQPGETLSVRYETNYRRPLFILIVIVGLAIGGYYFLRRSLSIYKKVVVVKKGDNTVLRVSIILKNNGKMPIKFLTLVERVPNIVSSPGEFVVRPDKVNKGESSATLLWNVKSIGKGEQRVYSYTVPVRLHAGGLVLPPAYVRYSDGVKRVMNSSNSVRI